MSDIQATTPLSSGAHRQDKTSLLDAPPSGAQAVAHVFKSFATILVIVGGGATYTYPRYLHEHLNASTTQSVYLGIIIAVGTIIFASVFAFFGCMINLSAQIECNTRESALLSRSAVSGPAQQSL